ncbi:ShlB/FhaC/HecB family hemolysin secretion/activation protein [Novosphingobium sp.]|uniref:ShlB/FhaC/HecB family hemolysin secretion/activation protein n=1 Tax=Novosphingobium sp. TaxID=1874826 RepID=UPI003BAC2481
MPFRPSCAFAAIVLIALAPLPENVRAAAPVLAPGVDPGLINESLRRQFELDRPVAPPQPSVSVDAAPPAEPSTRTSLRFALKTIQFDQSHYFGPDTLAALARPLEGREVGIDELQALVARINALYTARGLATARAVLAPQAVEGGIVKIRLVEGRLGAITVTGGSARSQRRVRGVIALRPGDLADPRDLEARLRQFNRENDGHLRAGLTAGQGLGQTDLELQLIEPPRLGLEVFADNNGYRSTGMWEEGAIIRAYRVLGTADRASLVAVRSPGVKSVSGAWSAPIGTGTRFGLAASYGETTIRQSTSNPLSIAGRSNTVSGDLAFALANRNSFALHLDTTLSFTQSDTRISGERVVDNQVTTAGAALLFDIFTPHLVGSGHIEANFSHVEERVSGSVVEPLILRGDLQLSRPVGSHGNYIRFRGDGQWTGAGALPGLLQYQIGGARSARALDPGTAAGDSGFTVALETGHAQPIGRCAIDVGFFLDHAEAYAAGQPAERATDIGTSLTFSLNNRISIRGQYALAVDHSGPGVMPRRGYLSVSARF